ncbi:probable salivary secreted peptide [Nasonia vitripennis]|uniref:Salivary secreted peptide n=1 Tax=Nasonia vitripennis TaxID=7425 RepID=A0A7M7G196_NASVI|nr:probable salivary secreted peptide [Nasonia vitripennis]XP_016843590.1 probable salivary secreted peptide [Nasonia vitripennis]
MTSQYVFILAVFATLAVTFANNDLIIGDHVAGDRLLQLEHIEKDAAWWGEKGSITRTFEGDTFAKITMVRALDKHDNGHGATAEIIAGGVGHSYVTIKFVSERLRGIDFIVEIYGK